MTTKKVELLVPAGNFECFEAAVNNGADAIYLGGEDFSARAYADNFTREEIIKAINFAHIRNVKVYVSINTTVYDDEIERVLDFADFLYVNDVDALIVADFGLVSLFKKRYPNLPIHVSTQANTHSLDQVKFFESLGVDRVILARETSLDEIRHIKENSHIELETFVHGALCICYSGNCLHSSMIGKRSGNRGKCAQPCRMEYTLLDGNKPISEKKYLLSTKDLCTIEHIDKIINSGVLSLKVEGRMKSKEYVALVTKSYRDAIDNYLKTKSNKVDSKALANMKLVFSRDFTRGFILNERNIDFTNTFRPSHIGTKIGKVISLKNDNVQVKLTEGLKQKDKIAIIQDRFEDVGMFISRMMVKGKLVPQAFKDEVVDLPINSKVAVGSTIYKVVDNDLIEKINDEYLKNNKRVPIKMKFNANVGEAMSLVVRDYDDHYVVVNSDYVVEKANTSPTLNDKIVEQLSKLNDTPYYLERVNVYIDNEGIMPVKFINELRRKAIELLNAQRANVYNRKEEDIVTLKDYSNNRHFKKQDRQFKVKVANLEQLDAIANLTGIDAIYYDDIYTYNVAKQRYNNLNLIPVLPRITNEKVTINSNYYVVNNFGELFKNNSNKIITDLYMNVANIETIHSLMNFNVNSITLSPELNKNQIEELVNDYQKEYGMVPPLEMVVYGHYQTMVMKHCFIAKQQGNENKNCGFCRKKQLYLQDRKGFLFPLKTTPDCIVTILNSKATHLIKYVDEIYDMGITSIRLDFSVESKEEVKEITEAYLNNDIYYQVLDATYGYYLETEKN